MIAAADGAIGLEVDHLSAIPNERPTNVLFQLAKVIKVYFVVVKEPIVVKVTRYDTVEAIVIQKHLFESPIAHGKEHLRQLATESIVVQQQVLDAHHRIDSVGCPVEWYLSTQLIVR